MVDASSTETLDDPLAAIKTPLKSPRYVSIVPSHEGDETAFNPPDSAVALGSPAATKDGNSNQAVLSTKVPGDNVREKHHQLQSRLQDTDGDANEDEPQPSDLVKHFIDFARVLDDRMARLENRKPKRPLKAQTWSNQLTTVNIASSQEMSETIFAPLSRRLTETDTKATEILRELCPANESSENHILRVGCHGLASSTVTNSSLTTDGDPNPERIEVIFISIKSRAISGFLEAQTGFKFDIDGLIHMTRPFKILIQNAAAIEEQLNKLELRYGLVFYCDSSNLKSTN